MENPNGSLRLAIWGVVGIVSAVIAHTQLAWGVFFNWGTWLTLSTFVVTLTLLALLTTLSFFLFQCGSRRSVFSRFLTAVFATWVLIGAIFGVMFLAKLHWDNVTRPTPSILAKP